MRHARLGARCGRVSVGTGWRGVPRHKAQAVASRWRGHPVAMEGGNGADGRPPPRCLQEGVAEVQLASRGSLLGIISRSVLKAEDEVLVHGNELLYGLGAGEGGHHDRSGYTLDAVQAVLVDVAPPSGLAGPATAFDWFAGYLVLDALVGNTDRHQENWGVIRRARSSHLAPSFDHASCLGFQISDAERVERLEGPDQRGRSVSAYAEAARSKFDGHPKLRDLAVDALERSGPAREHWVRKVEALQHLDSVLAGIPESRMGPTARRFAEELYAINRQTLLHRLRRIPS
jgi:hypothetical protein